MKRDREQHKKDIDMAFDFAGARPRPPVGRESGFRPKLFGGKA